ncbi:MAG: site-2 protease family protein [Chloroflexi bacterium]|nr:site-2 protease family protein [Chloroflexota bacterium]MDK1045004.1 M50 family metallopeptidase [Anaerolineales bacterium]MCH8340018.1 site-2 protease family protein [Chloroflexota bacterium]MCH8875358.1 site-2 protease family protein [Chloroflexota bacterium]MCI0772605.1 site-2 protease family protein [Chloroflexota bacterium]
MTDFVLFALVLGALIVGHELGHFIAARLTNVRVKEFGLGFPPRLVTLFEAGGTRFTLNLIPLGGFVRPDGEDDPSVEDGLAAANKRTRAAVLIAGPLANVLLAVVAFTAAYKFAAPDPELVLITSVEPGSPAASAGALAKDIILAIDQVEINNFQTLQEAINDRLGDPTSMLVRRGEELVRLPMTPRLNPPEGQGPVGVTLGNPTRAVGWLEAIGLGLNSTRFQFTAMVYLPSRLIRGELAPEEARISGLKGMYDMMVWAGQIDRSSQRPFLTLNLIGVISAGLALANLLPIPALDGGRLMFVGFEAVFGKRALPEHEGLAHTVGFMVLLALIIYVNLQDFINPINLPR